MTFIRRSLSLLSIASVASMFGLVACSGPADSTAVGSSDLSGTDDGGVETIPLETPGVEAPSFVELVAGPSAPFDFLAIDYGGPHALGCNGNGLNVGVVQNGAVVSTTAVTPYDFDTCIAHVPLTGLVNGTIGMFFSDKQGHFDSNFGANYLFKLDLTIIPGRGPDGDIINLAGHEPSAFAGGPPFSSVEADIGAAGELEVYYLGSALHCSSPISVGVVQGGVTVATGTASLDTAVISNPCVARIPLTSLVDGKIQFFFSQPGGAFDSNNGANYTMDLNKEIAP